MPLFWKTFTRAATCRAKKRLGAYRWAGRRGWEITFCSSPICVLEKFSDFKQVCQQVNDSAFGLQAGIFTTDINKAFYAYNTLDVGGVVINDIPSVRVDAMPVR